MNIHEFQAKQVLSHYGIPAPKGTATDSPLGARGIAEKMFEEGAKSVAVKAQVHAGGRGKAGGIKVVKNPEEAEKAAAGLLGKTLITHQTGPEGKPVNMVLVEEGTAVKKELYLSVVLDRRAAAPAIVASEAGGMDIEEVAKTSPEKIATITVNPVLGLRDFQVRELLSALGLSGEPAKAAREIIYNLFQLFMEMDCSLAEINPLVLTEDDKLLALDAKLNFDDSALFRHPEISQLRDPDQEDPLEVEAGKHNLNYIKLEGEIGCMVNGAGLAMATMDMIKSVGLSPANFLDVGGGASQEMIENAFRILLSDPKVKAVLINIFGGILRCDVLARGIVEAAKNVELKVPMVIRLEGTNVDEGRRILKDSGLSFTVAEDFKDAAEKLKQVMARG